MAKKGSTGKPATKEWAKHLKPHGKRDAAKKERIHSKADIKERLNENATHNDKFKTFLEALKGNGNDALIENIKLGYRVCFEGLEHTIGPYYYDSKAGKYYNKSSDMYVDAGEVESQLNAQQNAVNVYNAVLSKAFKLGLIDAKDFQRNHSRVQWDERMSDRMHRAAKAKGISVVDLFNEAKKEFS